MVQLTKRFGKIASKHSVPNLLNLQVDSYFRFLQLDAPPAGRKDEGLEGVFRSVFPIEDFNKTASLEYVSYDVGTPKYDEAECISKGLTFEAPVRITVRLVVYDVDDETGNRTIRDIKEQDIYFGTIPLMTDKGTFIINGTERVIVNQLQRSPGIIFEHDSGKSHSSGRVLYSCRVIPMRGSWLDFDFDHKDILHVRIDRRRKMPATILFKAMGMSSAEILAYFYDTEYYRLDEGRLMREVREDLFSKEVAYGRRARHGRQGHRRRGQADQQARLEAVPQAGIESYEIDPALGETLFLAEDLADAKTGEVVATAAEALTAEVMEKLVAAKITRVPVLYTRGADRSSSLRDTLMLDKTTDMATAQIEIYRRPAPQLPADPRDRGHVLREPVPQRGLLRPVQRRPLQAQFAPRPGPAAGPPHADQRGHPAGHPASHQAEGYARPGGRHRPPGQPPRAARGRAGREPVPHRPGAHGARHQGAHELCRKWPP